MNSQEKSIYKLNNLMSNQFNLNNETHDITNMKELFNSSNVKQIPLINPIQTKRINEINTNIQTQGNTNTISNINKENNLLNNKRKRYITNNKIKTPLSNDGVIDKNNFDSFYSTNKAVFEKNKPLNINNINNTDFNFNNTAQGKVVYNNINEVRLINMSHIEFKNSQFNNSIIQVLPFKITSKSQAEAYPSRNNIKK